MAEQKSVQRAENQPLRPARSAGHNSDVARLQAVLANMRKRNGASVDSKSFHPGKVNKTRRPVGQTGLLFHAVGVVAEFAFGIHLLDQPVNIGLKTRALHVEFPRELQVVHNFFVEHFARN